MSRIEKVSDNTHVLRLNDGRAFALSNRRDASLDTVFWMAQQRNWEKTPHTVCGEKVVPFGFDNNLPAHLRDILDENNLGPGILERQMGLLYGQGVFLNRLGYKDGEIVHLWEEDRQIQEWLESFDYVSYIKGCMTDYLHLKGFFDAKFLARGRRLGRRPFISRLEHISAKNARLEWPDSMDIKDVKHIVVGDFEHSCVGSGVRVFPVYDPRDPGKFAASASYNHTYSFARDFYAVPQYWGALRWIVKGSEVPAIFKYVTDNGINLAYIVKAPREYWDERRERIRMVNPTWSDAEVENEVSRLTEELLHQMQEVLSGKENAGKFFYSLDMPSENGAGRVSWTVEAIDQKMKDFVEAQLKISEASASAITSGMGLHPSLSNVMVNGKLASGSELLYAFKLFLLSDTEIASQTILEPVNQAIAFNFPDKGLKLGFYHRQLQSEEALTESARVKNQ